MNINWFVIIDIFDIVNFLDVIIDLRKNKDLLNDIDYCIFVFVVLSVVIFIFSFFVLVREVF